MQQLNDINMNIGNGIRIVRKESGLSQSKLGKSIRMTVNSVANLESGRVFPRNKMFDKLGVMLKSTPDYILLNSIEDTFVDPSDKMEFNKCKNKLKEIMQRANNSLYGKD